MSISSVEFQHPQGIVLSKGRGLPSYSFLTIVDPLGLASQLRRHLVNEDLQQGVLVKHSHHVAPRHGGLDSLLLHLGLRHDLHLGRAGV